VDQSSLWYKNHLMVFPLCMQVVPILVHYAGSSPLHLLSLWWWSMEENFQKSKIHQSSFSYYLHQNYKCGWNVFGIFLTPRMEDATAKNIFTIVMTSSLVLAWFLKNQANTQVKIYPKVIGNFCMVSGCGLGLCLVFNSKIWSFFCKGISHHCNH